MNRQVIQQGFSLLEVLVAGVLVTVVMVGMVLLQSQGQNQAFNAHARTLAGVYSQDLQERLRTNLCYLLPGEVDDIENLITDDLDNFLDDLRKAWESDHFHGSRSGWSSTLESRIEGSDAQSQALHIKGYGYWRFELVITLSPDRKVSQNLVVEHEGGCL